MNNIDKQVLIETLKSDNSVRSFGFYEFTDAENEELGELKRLLKKDWDGTSEKVYKKREEEVRKLEMLGEVLIQHAFPGEPSTSEFWYDITIMISKKT